MGKWIAMDFTSKRKKGRMQMYPVNDMSILKPYKNTLRISEAVSVWVRGK
jgi:hypothetical protein